MNNTILRLLQIFENETDDDNALTKVEIIDLLEQNGYEKINEKQFYRKIEELRDNGYDVEMRKGKQTRYFLRKNRLTREEWIVLLTMILGNKDLSKKETRHIIDSLESMSVCLKSIEYVKEYKDIATAEKSPFNQLGNFHSILDAIENKKDVECKVLNKNSEKLEISDLKILSPRGFVTENNQIIINVIEKGDSIQYFLGNLIDVEII